MNTKNNFANISKILSLAVKQQGKWAIFFDARDYSIEDSIENEHHKKIEKMYAILRKQYEESLANFYIQDCFIHGFGLIFFDDEVSCRAFFRLFDDHCGVYVSIHRADGICLSENT
jgi:hypothetical protein